MPGESARPGVLVPRFGIALAAALAAVVVFLPVLHGQFLTWDDATMFTGNHAYRGLGVAQLSWMATTTLMGHYMPLTWLTFGVTYVLSGMDPWAYHLGSLLLHAVNAALVAWFAGRLFDIVLPQDGAATRAVPAGAAVAGLSFGVHPLRAENVAWIADRGDLLCAAFFLLALLAYVRAIDERGSLRWRPWGGLALLAMGAALLSKEIATTLPAVLLVLDAYPLRRVAGWAQRLREKLPFFLLALAGAVVALMARAASARFSTVEQYGVGSRLAMAAHSLWYFVSATVWPSNLAPYHEPPAELDALAPRFLGAAIAVVLITIAVALLRRRWFAGLAVWVAYAVVLLPVSGVVHSGSHLVAERYGYLPGVALALLLGGGVAACVRMASRVSSARVPIALLLALVVLGVASWAAVARAHAQSWRDNLTFWQVSAAADPGCRLCVLNLASEHYNAGRFGEAEIWARRAIPLWPGRGTPHHRLGAALFMQGRDAEAEHALREAIRLAPRLGEAHREMGRLYARQGRDTEATTALREALLLGVSAVEVEAVLRSLEKGRSRP